MNNGQSSIRLSRNCLAGKTAAADLGRTAAKFSTASSGFSGAELDGTIYPKDFLHTRPAIADSNNGSAKASCGVCWRRLPKTFASAANSISVNALSAGCLSSLKKGARSGKDRAGQRYEAHGSCPTALVFISPSTGASASPHEVSLVKDT